MQRVYRIAGHTGPCRLRYGAHSVLQLLFRFHIMSPREFDSRHCAPAALVLLRLYHLDFQSIVACSKQQFLFRALFLLPFLCQVVRARAGAQASSSSSSRSRRDERTTPTAFAVGLLDIAIPRDDRPGGSFARVMINDACINRAVHGAVFR